MTDMSGSDEIKEAKEEKDLFYHGVISKLFSGNNMGVVRTESGREIPFSFQFVILVGEVNKPSELKEGQVVGYDLGWTSDGLRVTKIKTYPGQSHGRAGTGSEGDSGQGQNFPS
jgi:hypothetical protein